MNDDDHETHDEYEARKAEHEKTVEAEPQTCPSCAGTGREGGVKGGIEPSPPIPRADIPPSPVSVFGTDAVCMPPVSAEPYRGIGRTGSFRANSKL